MPNQAKATSLTRRPRTTDLRFEEVDPFKAVFLSHEATLISGAVFTSTLIKGGFKVRCATDRIELVKAIVDLGSSERSPTKMGGRATATAR